MAASCLYCYGCAVSTTAGMLLPVCDVTGSAVKMSPDVNWAEHKAQEEHVNILHKIHLVNCPFVKLLRLFKDVDVFYYFRTKNVISYIVIVILSYCLKCR